MLAAAGALGLPAGKQRCCCIFKARRVFIPSHTHYFTFHFHFTFTFFLPSSLPLTNLSALLSSPNFFLNQTSLLLFNPVACLFSRSHLLFKSSLSHSQILARWAVARRIGARTQLMTAALISSALLSTCPHAAILNVQTE